MPLFIVIASEAWQSRRGIRLLRHLMPRNDGRGNVILTLNRFPPVIASEAWQSRWGMRLLRHLMPRNDGRGNVILTLNEVKGKNLVALRAVLMPKELVDKSQACFWTRRWQEAEREANEDIKAGRVKTFASGDELIKDLEQE